MKNIVIVACLIFSCLSLFSQDITGKWFGVLKMNKIELRIDLNIVKTEVGYTSTLDSPDQGAKGVFVDSTEFKTHQFRFKIIKGGIEFKGEYSSDDFIKGVFTQGGMSIPLE